MGSEFRNIIKVASIYMTAIIGAGFASGQEIVIFFSSYYHGGFYGIILAGILFSVIGVIVLDKVFGNRIRQYNEFTYPTMGWLGASVMEILVIMFMFCLFCIMVAGLGNILIHKFSISYYYAVIIMTVLIVTVIMTEIRGIVAISTFIAPVLVVGIAAIGIYIIIFNDMQVFNVASYLTPLTDNWFSSALIYVSYNSIMSVVVLCRMFPYLKSRKTGIIGGMLGGGMLMAVALILNFAIYAFFPDRLSGEIPVLNIVENYSAAVGNVYTLIIALAMFASAVTSGYFFIDQIKSKLKLNIKVLAIVFCLFTIPLSGCGFSSLIANLYPVFGYAGLFMLFVILFDGIRSVLKKRKVWKGIKG